MAVQLGPSDLAVQVGPSHLAVKPGASDLAVQIDPNRQSRPVRAGRLTRPNPRVRPTRPVPPGRPTRCRRNPLGARAVTLPPATLPLYRRLLRLLPTPFLGVLWSSDLVGVQPLR